MGAILQRYIPKLYWKIRDFVTKENGLLFFKKIGLFYIRWCDAYNNASLGTHCGGGATFETHPDLPHGLKGIVIAHNVKIGKKCRIFQNVCIGCDDRCLENAPVIGDNVVVYPGAVIIGKIHVGNNCIIAANSVVNKDVPDNTVVVCSPVRYLERKQIKQKD